MMGIEVSIGCWAVADPCLRGSGWLEEHGYWPNWETFGGSELGTCRKTGLRSTNLVLSVSGPVVLPLSSRVAPKVVQSGKGFRLVIVALILASVKLVSLALLAVQYGKQYRSVVAVFKLVQISIIMWFLTLCVMTTKCLNESELFGQLQAVELLEWTETITVFVAPDYRRNAFMEADLQCSNAIQSMEKRLRAACNASDAKIDNVAKEIIQGPGKWHKLAVFLQRSFEGPTVDLTKSLIAKVESEKISHALQCRLIEDKMALLMKRLEASEGEKSDYIKRYEDAIKDKKKLTDEYMNRITDLQSNHRLLDEKYSGILKTLDSTKQESMDWKRKYEQVLSRQKAEEDQASSEIAALKSRSGAAEARLAAAKEQAQSAQEEAEEWKRKYDIAFRVAKSALKKASIVQERTNKQTQLREDALREEFSGTLAEKEDEIREKTAKINHAEKCLATLNLELKVRFLASKKCPTGLIKCSQYKKIYIAAESKIRTYDSEISSLRIEIKELTEKLKIENARAQSYEREAMVFQQEKNHLDQKYQTEFKRFDEVQERCKIAEKEAARATEVAEG
ncbi:hypothetical protein V8G54_023143 [Vigna mungo]|uniref:Uncharacterized protein n=1 Tax=Vigna mungo TaxID=3915 RepID=A0AAQ3N3X5_VIGMU